MRILVIGGLLTDGKICVLAPHHAARMPGGAWMRNSGCLICCCRVALLLTLGWTCFEVCCGAAGIRLSGAGESFGAAEARGVSFEEFTLHCESSAIFSTPFLRPDGRFFIA